MSNTPNDTDAPISRRAAPDRTPEWKERHGLLNAVSVLDPKLASALDPSASVDTIGRVLSYLRMCAEVGPLRRENAELSASLSLLTTAAKAHLDDTERLSARLFAETRGVPVDSEAASCFAGLIQDAMSSLDATASSLRDVLEREGK